MTLSLTVTTTSFSLEALSIKVLLSTKKALENALIQRPLPETGQCGPHRMTTILLDLAHR